MRFRVLPDPVKYAGRVMVLVGIDTSDAKMVVPTFQPSMRTELMSG